MHLSQHVVINPKRWLLQKFCLVRSQNFCTDKADLDLGVSSLPTAEMQNNANLLLSLDGRQHCDFSDGSDSDTTNTSVLTAVLQARLFSQSPLNYVSLLVPEENLWEKWCGSLKAGCFSSHPTNSCQSIEKSKHWQEPGFILSSCITRLHWEGALLHLRWLTKVITLSSLIT